MDKKINKETLLERSLVFKALDEETRHDLAEFAYLKHYSAGDVIFTMGAPAQSMMAIAEGAVHVEMVTASGRGMTVGELRAGEVFGEIALLDGGERSATIRAQTNCTLVVIERSKVMEALSRNPELPIRLIELLCRRIRNSDERMLEIAFLDLPSRLSRLLLRLTLLPPATEDKPLTRLSLSQSELARMIGNTRENVNRCLRKWQKADVIDLKDGWLILTDRPALEAIAEAG